MLLYLCVGSTKNKRRDTCLDRSRPEINQMECLLLWGIAGLKCANLIETPLMPPSLEA